MPTAEAVRHSAKTFKKIESLPSAVSGALGKVFFKNNICRVPNSRHSAKKDVTKHRYAGQPMPSACAFAESLALGKEVLCREPFFAECAALGKELFAECNSLPSAALGKEGICRVPDF